MNPYYNQIATIIGTKLSKQKPYVDALTILEYDPSQVAPLFKKTMWRDMEVCYDDKLHLYFVNRENRVPLISVTTFIGLFTEKFNLEGMSLRCAQKRDYDCNCLVKDNWPTLPIGERQKRIKEAWAKNNLIATTYGTAAHAAQEYVAKKPHLSNDEIFNLVKLGEWGADAVKPNIKLQIAHGRSILKTYIDAGYEVIAEPVLVDPTLGMAGQSDLVLINHETKDIVILDHKTNEVAPDKKPTYNQMTGLFAEHPHNPMTEYSIQLSTYGMFVRSMYPGYAISEASLIWFDPITADPRMIPIDIDLWSARLSVMFDKMKEAGVFKRAYQLMDELVLTNQSV